MVSLQITIYGFLLTVSLLTTNANAGEFLQKIKSSMDSRTVRHKNSVDKLIHEAPNRIFVLTHDQTHNKFNHLGILPFFNKWLETLKCPSFLLHLAFRHIDFEDADLDELFSNEADILDPIINATFKESRLIARLLRDFVQDVQPIKMETALKIEAIVINENDSDANLKSIRDILSADLTSNTKMLLKKLFTFSAYWAKEITRSYSPEIAINLVYPEIAHLFFHQKIFNADTHMKITTVVTYLSKNFEDIFEKIN